MTSAISRRKFLQRNLNEALPEGEFAYCEFVCTYDGKEIRTATTRHSDGSGDVVVRDAPSEEAARYAAQAALENFREKVPMTKVQTVYKFKAPKPGQA